MERDSFIFYRSFYEAIRRMPPEVQAEIYPALAEYALFGTAPTDISDVAMAMFLLIQPNIDVNNKRFENGKKGAAYGKRGGRPRKKPANPEYSLTFKQEVDKMKTDADWSASVCEDYNISTDEYEKRLKRFLQHCTENRKDKPHDSFDDAKTHLRYWMNKAYPTQPATSALHAEEDINTPPSSDYTFNGGFGGMDV